ncbi:MULTISPECIES: hypothetical protein [unclassified Rathayibacter]|uniref:hypothetical protein n=1 Tax=unclassified Rathayibacter TaxID=2609250 RepID=UPI000CE8253A|nr:MULTISPECIES: hypothetical protein [unclassified Rathayibacter]PPH33543.1 hypothetical protein C5C94_03320 [Rathayibacter sp. AY1C3]PPI31973.1 hypothetical protein C5D66_07020 [Rathayibacter sp. AY1B4]
MLTLVESADPEHVERALSLVLDQGPDGIVALKFYAIGVVVLSLIPEHIAVVSLPGARGRLPQAVLDELRAAQALSEHLLELGHRTAHHVRTRRRAARSAALPAGIVR